MGDKTLQERATEIIKPLVPPDAEERVARSVKQWNQVIRDHIRTETGLKLSDGDARFTIPVRVVRGFPLSLAHLIDQHRDPAIWRLIIGLPKLGGLVEGLDFLIENWSQFELWPALPPPAKGGLPVLQRCQEIATSLQNLTVAREVSEQIKAIHEDILGIYHHPSGLTSSVELYWLPIAMVASMLDVRIEDLAVVVLIHELAHGYTHVGRDIDGTRWEDSAFGASDLGVVEGLAQFYTEAITESLAPRTPGLYATYEALLTLQSGPYLVHREWLKGEKRQRGETIRFTLIVTRSRGQTDYKSWMRLMAETSRNLGKLSLFDD